MSSNTNPIDDVVKELSAKITAAMNRIAKEGYAAMKLNTVQYYTGDKPKIYDRTGALGRSPQEPFLITSGKHWHLTLGLDDGYSYNTGSWSANEVLHAANAGALVGTGGFWDKTEEEVAAIVDRELGSIL